MAVVLVFCLLLVTGPLQAQPPQTTQQQALEYLTVVAEQSAKGNEEAKFLHKLNQYSISKDPAILKSLSPSNAIQSYLLSSLYAANQDLGKCAYWLDQTRSFLTSHKLDASLGDNYAENQTVAIASLRFMADLNKEAGKGNTEAQTILKVFNSVINHKADELLALTPTTATESYLAFVILLSQQNPSGFSFLGKAVKLLKKNPPASLPGEKAKA